MNFMRFHAGCWSPARTTTLLSYQCIDLDTHAHGMVFRLIPFHYILHLLIYRDEIL